MNIKYAIQFFSGWHCGSGLSAGADVDALVVKNQDGLPFVPGKTIKGLLREAVEDYAALTGAATPDQISQVFGVESVSQGVAFFGNAVLAEAEARAITEELRPHLYKRLSATAIGDNGIAKEHCLRRIEVVVPCAVHGEIRDVPENFAEILKNSMGFIKRLGSWRNRGLGRCAFKCEGN